MGGWVGGEGGEKVEGIEAVRMRYCGLGVIWVDGWVDGWVGGWVGGWVKRRTFQLQVVSFPLLQEASHFLHVGDPIDLGVCCLGGWVGG